MIMFRRVWRGGDAGKNSTHERCSARGLTMAERDDANELSWPWWAPWALLAVAVTSLLTIGATLYDIL
jgi:hypothetical protein